MPARKDKLKVINQKYKSYTDFTWISILRPMCYEHREITYLESLLLYLTQECKQIFTSLIKCDYLLEAQQVKAVRSQNKAILKGFMLRNSHMFDKNNRQVYDTSLIKGSLQAKQKVATFLNENMLQWKLWHALNTLQNPYSSNETA